MVKNYIEFQQSRNVLLTIKPNVNKIFLKNFLNILGITLLVSGILWIINLEVGLQVFLDVLKALGISIDPSSILFYSVMAVLAVSCLLLIGNYLANVNIKYEFYQNKLIAYLNSILVFTNSKNIPYADITRVLFNNKGIFNSMLNSGTIILEMSGTGNERMELKFIDNVENVVQSIQNAIKEFASIQQAQFTENYTIDRIMNRYD